METPLHILLTGDEETTCTNLESYLGGLGHQVEGTRYKYTALKQIHVHNYDIALVDLHMLDAQAIEFLAKIQKTSPAMPVVLISGSKTLQKVTELFRLEAAGACSQPIQLTYFDTGRSDKPCRDYRNLQVTLREIQAYKSLQTQNQDFVGNSPSTQQVRVLIQQAIEANVDTIFVTGETGTGKEVVARAIHFQASLQDCPFIAVNCSALPESLVESELFGHVKGAFTGATMDRTGYFELANNGTLFLDEIADLPAPAQAKILRAVDTRTLRPIGSDKEISVQERVISAINRNPADLVQSGKFRSDLFYRLNIFPIHLKPLRERVDDILPLADHFLAAYTTKSGRCFEGFSDKAQSFLLDYQYPGNVRELRNIVERSAILCPPEVSLIGSKNLNIHGHDTEKMTSQTGKLTVEDETKWILQALEETRWNRSQAAKNLGITYSALRFKINKLGIS